MIYIFFLSRILFGGYFVWNGFNHFKKLNSMAGYAAMKRVPMPKLAVAVSGLLAILGGLGIILGLYVFFAVLALVIFLVPVTFKMHAFWNETDPNAKRMEHIQFTKNLALLGGALAYLFI